MIGKICFPTAYSVGDFARRDRRVEGFERGTNRTVKEGDITPLGE